jgi:hypothetical protein
MATSVSASNLQMTVDPAPPRQPEAVSQRGGVAVETPAEATEVGD